MAAEILAALKAIPLIVESIRDLAALVSKMNDAITAKNIAELKAEVNHSLVKLKSAKSKDERAALIEELNKKLSK
jgi:uncharacterized membrane protein